MNQSRNSSNESAHTRTAHTPSIILIIMIMIIAQAISGFDRNSVSCIVQCSEQAMAVISATHHNVKAPKTIQKPKSQKKCNLSQIHCNQNAIQFDSANVCSPFFPVCDFCSLNKLLCSPSSKCSKYGPNNSFKTKEQQ